MPHLISFLLIQSSHMLYVVCIIILAVVLQMECWKRRNNRMEHMKRMKPEKVENEGQNEMKVMRKVASHHLLKTFTVLGNREKLLHEHITIISYLHDCMCMCKVHKHSQSVHMCITYQNQLTRNIQSWPCLLTFDKQNNTESVLVVIWIHPNFLQHLYMSANLESRTQLDAQVVN